MYKKNRTFFATLLFLFLAVPAFARPVDKKQAARTASELLRKQVVDATPADFTQCYLFVGADGTGFALLAADDLVSPLLGYSREGVFPTDCQLPRHIDAWLKGYQDDIAETVKAGVEAPKYNHPRDTAVGPLMTTTWNQRPLYNAQCPYDFVDSAYTVTGCVATATAQVMKYWNHPAVGRGSHSYTYASYGPQSANFETTYYDWAHMPDALNANSSDEEIAAVAQLMHHIGIAVEMKYGVHGSSASLPSFGDISPNSAEKALKNYFRYNQALFSAYRDDYSAAEWDSLLVNELNASRPIPYSGYDNEAGHAFVIDGYDSLGLFHVNWGWGGSCDGYYTFDNLSPTSSGVGGNPSNSYSKSCCALLQVFPASENPTVSVSVVNANPTVGTVTGGGTFPCYTPTTLFATAPEGYRFRSWKNGNHENPFPFSPNNDYSDTAFFAPIYGDTLGYSYSYYHGLWGESDQHATEFGIRIPAASIPSHRQLNAILFWGALGENYTIKALLGNNMEQLVFSTNYATSDERWCTVPLPEPVPLIDNQPLWITFSGSIYSNPAGYGSYSGNPDGSWYKRDGATWEHMEDRGEYKSWPIWGMLGELEQVTVSAESSHPDRGSVGIGSEGQSAASVSATYYPGDTVVLTATPNAGYRFVGWSTGERDNPLVFRVTSAVDIVATFAINAALDDVEDNALSYTLNDLTLNVNNPSAEQLSLYDIQGRLLSTSQLPVFNYQFSGPGVFILRSGSIAKKIIIQ